jgi:small-conductance mechanosensitive channel
MVETLSKVISQFPGAANRARCTAHIVNLVSKIILRQFDAGKKTKGTKNKTAKANDEPSNTGNDNDDPNLVDDEDDFTGLAEELDREEQEVVDEDDEDTTSQNVEADLDEVEEAMKEEVLEVAKKVKPIKHVLYKVRSFIIVIILTLTSLTYIFLYLLSAPEARLRNKKINDNSPPSMVRNLRRTRCCCSHY